jgi:hypothetical protein
MHKPAFPLSSAIPLLTSPHSPIAYPQMNTYTHMVLTNGAQACDVFWRVGSAATFNVGSTVVGTVMAYSAITVQTNVQVEGRLFALNAAVTLDTATVVFPC